MKKSAFAVGVCFLALVLGCGSKLDPPVDPDQAGAVLQTAFESWKQGDSYGDLAKRDPPIVFSEPEWAAGKKLVDFKLGKVELMGRQGRCTVKLTLKDKEGNTKDRQIGYQIDTIPRVVIVREALGP
jgi:hypothetical protein